MARTKLPGEHGQQPALPFIDGAEPGSRLVAKHVAVHGDPLRIIHVGHLAKGAQRSSLNRRIDQRRGPTTCGSTKIGPAPNAGVDVLEAQLVTVKELAEPYFIRL